MRGGPCLGFPVGEWVLLPALCPEGWNQRVRPGTLFEVVAQSKSVGDHSSCFEDVQVPESPFCPLVQPHTS